MCIQIHITHIYIHVHTHIHAYIYIIHTCTYIHTYAYKAYMHTYTNKCINPYKIQMFQVGIFLGYCICKRTNTFDLLTHLVNNKREDALPQSFHYYYRSNIAININVNIIDHLLTEILITVFPVFVDCT